MKLKRLAIVLIGMAISVTSVFAFSASAIIWTHDRQLVISQKALIPNYDANKSWSYSYKLQGDLPYKNRANGAIGDKKGGITSADVAVSSIGSSNGDAKLVHTISISRSGNAINSQVEDMGYSSCSASANGKLWIAATGRFHQCTIDDDDFAWVYLWG